jgi:hypothetical protein
MDFSIPVFKTGALSHSAIPPFYEENPSKATEFYHIQSEDATFGELIWSIVLDSG